MHFPFTSSVSYADPAKKVAFHQNAKKALRALAKELGLSAGAFDLRSNMGGVAVSGEITLHSDTLYVQASQSAMGNEMGLLIRSCKGRKDYTGGHNTFAPLNLLNDAPALATLIRSRRLA